MDPTEKRLRHQAAVRKCREKNKEKYNKQNRQYKKDNARAVNIGQNKRYYRRKLGLPPPPRQPVPERSRAQIKEIAKRYRRTFAERHYGTGDNADVARLCRTRIGTALRRESTKKLNSCIKLLGCTWSEIREHLGPDIERRRELGLHIDHIWPVHLYDLSDPEEQLNVFNYKNTRLCTKKENMEKSSSVPEASLADSVPRHLWPKAFWASSEMQTVTGARTIRLGPLSSVGTFVCNGVLYATIL